MANFGFGKVDMSPVSGTRQARPANIMEAFNDGRSNQRKDRLAQNKIKDDEAKRQQQEIANRHNNEARLRKEEEWIRGDEKREIDEETLDREYQIAKRTDLTFAEKQKMVADNRLAGATTLEEADEINKSYAEAMENAAESERKMIEFTQKKEEADRKREKYEYDKTQRGKEKKGTPSESMQISDDMKELEDAGLEGSKMYLRLKSRYAKLTELKNAETINVADGGAPTPEYTSSEYNESNVGIIGANDGAVGLGGLVSDAKAFGSNIGVSEVNDARVKIKQQYKLNKQKTLDALRVTGMRSKDVINSIVGLIPDPESTWTSPDEFTRASFAARKGFEKTIRENNAGIANTNMTEDVRQKYIKENHELGSMLNDLAPPLPQTLQEFEAIPANVFVIQLEYATDDQFKKVMLDAQKSGYDIDPNSPEGRQLQQMAQKRYNR